MVPSEMIRWAMHNFGVEEWLVSAMSIYTAAKTVVRTVYDNSKCFEVKVSMLFLIVMEALSTEFRVVNLIMGVVVRR